ncbi:MAG: hypothetical protein JKY01_04090 [Pseudomonadales bacterium]|nr:hypothetical protein [Pseudomonadales bacterium]
MIFRIGLGLSMVICLAMSSLLPAEDAIKGASVEEALLLGAVRLQVASMNEENLDAYVEGMHPKAPIYERYKTIMGQLFAVYDLSTRAEGIRVLSVDKDYSVVRLTLSKRKIKGRARFVSSITDSLWVYRKMDGSWLLWSTLKLSL